MTANKGPDPLGNLNIDFSSMPPVLIEDVMRDRTTQWNLMAMNVKACATLGVTTKIFGKTPDEWCKIITRATLGDTDTDYTVTGEK